MVSVDAYDVMDTDYYMQSYHIASGDTCEFHVEHSSGRLVVKIAGRILASETSGEKYHLHWAVGELLRWDPRPGLPVRSARAQSFGGWTSTDCPDFPASTENSGIQQPLHCWNAPRTPTEKKSAKHVFTPNVVFHTFLEVLIPRIYRVAIR